MYYSACQQIGGFPLEIQSEGSLVALDEILPYLPGMESKRIQSAALSYYFDRVLLKELSASGKPMT